MDVEERRGMTNTMLTLLSAGRLQEHTAQGFWRGETIYDLAAGHAARAPESFAVRDRARRISYRDLVAAADALAGDLAARGVRPGQRVAVWLPGRVETAIALLACSRNGYVCCPSLHRDHTVGEIAALVERMRAAAIITEPRYGANGDRADLLAEMRDFPHLRHVYSLRPVGAEVGTEPDTALPYDGLLLGAPLMLPASGDPNKIMYLPFTSGTTGQPKGVLHSDNTLIASARTLGEDWHFGPESKVYTLSPLSHNLGLGALVSAVVVGAELVVHDLPRGRSLLDRLVETGATFLFGVPTHAIDLLGELRARGASRLGEVRGFRISGAAASPKVISELMTYGVTPQSGYGMTETCSHQYTMPDEDPRLIAESCGRSCRGYEVRIWRQDNPDEEAAVGEVGQIGGRGASLMLGYFDDQATTEESFNALGWFMTGDLGWMDENGYLRITGRRKDVIIRGGHNIYPARIESLAMQHPAIDKVAAFPVADDRLGELVCLAIVPRVGKQLSGEEILEHLDRVGLSKYDMPEYLVWLDVLPLTASGKIVKRDLIDLVARGELTPQPVRFKSRTPAVG
jgi:acyl-CoA synthetase (AMP-forming)/AMP-acid ligase II